MAKLQFYKGTTAPDVATYKTGTIWFDKTNRVLKVRIAETGAASDWEQYAGKLDDIKLEKSGEKAGYLVVTKADGTNIEVNLNDIASAGSVAQAIQNLQNQIDGLGSRVGTLESKVDVDKVSTAISNAVSTAIQGLDAEEDGSSADGKVTVKVTEADGKITAVAVTTDDIASASDLSGVSSRVGTLETKVGDSSVADQITTAIQDLDATVNSTGGAKVGVKVTEVDGKITKVEVSESDIASASDLSGVSSRVGTLEGKVDVDKVSEAISGAVSSAIQGLDAVIDSTGGAKVGVKVTEVDGKITAVKVTETDIASASEVAGEISGLKQADQDLTDELNTLKNKVDSFGSPLRFRGVTDTAPTEDLKEGDFYITTAGVEYIYAKTGDGGALKWEKVGDTSAEAQQIADALSRIGALEGKVDVTKVSTAIAAAIQDLDAVKEGESTDGKVGVKVTEADGKITAVEVTTDDIASASDLSGVSSRVGALETKMGNSSVADQISIAIQDLDAVKEGESTDGKVSVKVTEADGKITTVEVTTDDIASASDLSGVSSRVGALEGKVDVAKVSEAIAGAIGDLDATVNSTGGAKVGVKVTEADGKITKVEVSETDIASASELNNAVSRIAAVETQLTWGGFN